MAYGAGFEWRVRSFIYEHDRSERNSIFRTLNLRDRRSILGLVKAHYLDPSPSCVETDASDISIPVDSVVSECLCKCCSKLKGATYLMVPRRR